MNPTSGRTILYSILFLVVAAILLMCAVPPVSRDALTHHLAVPLLYLRNGGMYELPHIKPSYYPQFLDLIYCLPLYFKNDILPKYIHFLFGGLTSFLIYCHMKERINKFTALLCALFFLSLPVIIKLSTTVYVDLGLIFFSFAALVSLLKWREHNFKLRWLLLASFCCGLALSTKYNGLITLFLLVVFIPFLFLAGSNKSRIRQFKGLLHGFTFLLIALALFSPWMIKNYAWTGNPLYPLYNTIFNEEPAPFDTDRPAEWNHFLTRRYVFNETWFETALIPVRIFFQGEDDNPKYFDGRLNPLLFFLPFFAFWGAAARRDTAEQSIEKKTLLAFSLLFILAVFLKIDMRIRWAGPAIPGLVVLSGYGLHNLVQFSKKIPRLSALAMAFLLLITAGFNFVYLYKEFQSVAPLRYIAGEVTRDEYIQKRRPEYAALQFANRHLDQNSKILAFFMGNRRYYAKHDIFFEKKIFKDLVKGTDTPRAVWRGLKTQNFSHIVLNYAKFGRWVDMSFEAEEKTIVKKFFAQYARQLFSKDNHGLYSLEGHEQGWFYE